MNCEIIFDKNEFETKMTYRLPEGGRRRVRAVPNTSYLQQRLTNDNKLNGRLYCASRATTLRIYKKKKKKGDRGG